MTKKTNKTENIQKKSEYPGSWSGKLPGRNPVLGLETIKNTMNELIKEIFFQFSSAPFEIPWKPAADMYSSGNMLYIRVSLPGADKNSINLHVTRNLLIVQGRMKPPKLPGNSRVFFYESRWGEFSRSLPLPFGVETENVESALKGGILTIKIPFEKKTENTKKTAGKE